MNELDKINKENGNHENTNRIYQRRGGNSNDNKVNKSSGNMKYSAKQKNKQSKRKIPDTKGNIIM